MASFFSTSARKGRLNLSQEIVAGVGGFLLMLVAIFLAPFALLIAHRRESLTVMVFW